MGLLNLLRTGKGPMDGWVARGYDRGVQAAFREVFPALVGDLLEEMAGARRALDAGYAIQIIQGVFQSSPSVCSSM